MKIKDRHRTQVLLVYEVIISRSGFPVGDHKVVYTTSKMPVYTAINYGKKFGTLERVKRKL